MSSGSPNFISRNRGMLMLMAPIVAFLALFFAWPVVLVLGNSFGGDGGPIGEYIEFFTSNTYVRIVFRTIFVALLVTALCLLIGYPYAYLMVRTKGKMLAFLTGVVLLSFFTSVMVRSFAWIVMLQRNGIIDRIAQWLGFDGLVLRGSTTGVTIAMVQVMLPFMIFPLYSAMAGIDTRLERASTSLGATKWTTFRDIWFPLSMPGVIGGSVIVFVTSLGFYVIPGLVGSPSNQLLSHLIYSLINTVLNVPLASAASVVMLLIALLVVLPTMMRYDVTGSTTSRFASDEGRGGKQSIWLWIFGALVIALLLVPGLVVIPLSFPENRSFAFPPQGFSWQWYANFFSSRQWWGAFITSIQVAVLVTFTSTVLAVFAGLALRRSSTRVRTVIRALVLTPRIVPGVIIALAVYGLFLDWRLNITITGFVIAHTIMALPFAFIPIAATLEQFDTRFEQAAASLGASRLTTFFQIILPLISTGMMTGALFAFVISFDEVVVSLFVGGVGMRTLPVQMYNSIANDIDPTIAAASTMLLLLTAFIVIASTIFTQRRAR
ncbi:iron ABC transporter permease [Oceaniovalibus sp. ACAM 378]|uniref:ABC transporter permease n=1 Tax=Oceaniovalibus sp. ACAM 378 TaxID=2599923 RepID=UPI0011D58EA4|nr:ABC transporter permease subunit [Oceaniovalibus sp. ACAM 378]TYB85787.1 ABC transporter permease subunit [Oceaniovalibus sp. ACAM 378]